MSQTSAAIEWVSDGADAPFLLADGALEEVRMRARPTLYVETQLKAALRQTKNSFPLALLQQ